ncbi:thiol reductant ABC exporter subunit CydD [Fructilactobacillus myrtifloralis]|uniref:Thiol reductant ABC exporter subunit CydD n=1 Tax=Fructilactobacillus myrtifloralis TaxID=2940301 RepID=A0ABY5BN41_9LACO|nr:thiol reductant ABC exporter subunit CydD [Fructilactobacillus myrtifloralis]USS84518.1 thiol reductant ABC exporter subunit CydD [Fructilactobacillus myrtifloralis]
MFDRQLLSIPGIKPLIGKLSGLAVLQALAIVLEAVFLARALVLVWQRTKIADLIWPVLSFFVFFALRYLITRIENQMTDTFAERAVARLKSQLLHQEFRLGPRMVSEIGSGHVVTLALEGLDQVQNYLNLIVIKTINLAILPWLIVAYIFYVNWLSGVILLVMFPVIILFMVILGLSAKAKSDRQYAEFKQMANVFVDSIRGLKTLKLFGLSKQYGSNIYRVSENYRKSTMSVLKVALLSTFALDFFTTISIAIVAVLLGQALIGGAIGLLPALTILILCPDYFLPVRDYGDDYHATLDGKNALTEVNAILALPTPHSQITLTKFTNWTATSTLTTRDLSFRYAPDVAPALAHLNLTVQGYQNVGIIGKSGAGKSTLLNVLGGWLEPTKTPAPLVVDGQAVDSLAQATWQKHISYIPQHPYLFAGTVAENVAFYKPNASEAEVQRAIRQAGLDQFVASLPAGLATRIGEGGRGISGGQAQRIALARALLDQERTILLFDEPTAHLDLETEYDLKQTMVSAFHNHLVLFSTHRLHWLSAMDYVLVMDQGQIVDQGTPAELQQHQGVYRALVNEIRGEHNAD